MILRRGRAGNSIMNCLANEPLIKTTSYIRSISMDGGLTYSPPQFKEDRVPVMKICAALIRKRMNVVYGLDLDDQDVLKEVEDCCRDKVTIS